MPTIITRGAVSAKAYGFGVSGGYSVGKSLRFRSSASAYLNRTPASSGNRQIFTFSFWIKRGQLGTSQGIFHSFTSQTNSARISFNSQDVLILEDGTSGTSFSIVTNQVFRDPSAWYHIIMAVDTTQATSTNRVKLYVNGNQVTSFNGPSYPAQNGTTCFNQNIDSNWSRAYFWGAAAYAYLDGYLAEVNFIDGQALTASSFGTYDTNGVWQPIKYSGSFGTNGFYLNFGNTTSTTTLGYDTSGNGNNWTTNNISLTAGTTYDSMTDSPTVTSASVANYAVMNPLKSTANVINGNLQPSNAGSSGYYTSYASIEMFSGKYYWEISIADDGVNSRYLGFGIANISNALTSIGASVANTPAFYSNGWMQTIRSSVNAFTTGLYNNNSGVNTTTRSTTTGTHVLGLAYDSTTGYCWIAYDNTWYSGNPSAGTGAYFTASGRMTPFICAYNDGSASSFAAFVNFGQQPFTYTPPTGFNALNTYNLPTPTIANGAQYMAATTYTGTGAIQSINDGSNTTIGTTFQPDFVWLKTRSASAGHVLIDSVRGPTFYLNSNTTNAEAVSVDQFLSFNSNGFTLGANALAGGSTNQNGTTYIGWQWKASGSTSSNTNGSITSTVSANTTAGFSVVTFTTPTSGTATIGHGLGVAPSLMILKGRSNATGWGTYHISTGNGGYLVLNTTGAFTSDANAWNNTSPTSSVFTIGTTFNNLGTYVAYCWAAVAGYSAFGSYTGNGSSDGTFVYTGFRPRWIMVKQTTASSTTNWWIYDSSRDIYNVAGDELAANTSNAESSGNTDLDLLSNGFKFRSSTGGLNGSGGTYIYAAFAESPFQISRAR